MHDIILIITRYYINFHPDKIHKFILLHIVNPKLVTDFHPICIKLAVFMDTYSNNNNIESSDYLACYKD